MDDPENLTFVQLIERVDYLADDIIYKMKDDTMRAGLALDIQRNVSAIMATLVLLRAMEPKR